MQMSNEAAATVSPRLDQATTGSMTCFVSVCQKQGNLGHCPLFPVDECPNWAYEEMLLKQQYFHSLLPTATST